MALSRGNKILWSDISAIFTRISTQRQRFGYSSVSAASYGGVGTPARASLVTNMKNLLTQIAGNSLAFFAVNAYTISVPAVGSLLYPAPFITMQNMLTTLENTCVHFSNFANFANFNPDFANFNNFGNFGNFGSDFANFNNFGNFGNFGSDFGNFSNFGNFGNFGSDFGNFGNFGNFSDNSTFNCTYFNSSFTFGSFSCSPYKLPN